MILALLLVGFLKFKWGVGDYCRYLNEKIMSDSVSKVHILKPSTYGNLFWDRAEDCVSTGEAYLESEVEELELEWLELEDEDMDVFDPEFAEDFESFFEGIDSSDEEESEEFLDVSEEDSFGFVSEESGLLDVKSGDVSDVEEDLFVDDQESIEDWISDNKQKLLNKLK